MIDLLDGSVPVGHYTAVKSVADKHFATPATSTTVATDPETGDRYVELRYDVAMSPAEASDAFSRLIAEWCDTIPPIPGEPLRVVYYIKDQGLANA